MSAFSRSTAPDRSSQVPTSPPIARLRMKRTGNSLFAILGNEAFIPSTRQQSPKPLNNAFLYFSAMPERTKAPKAPPTSIVTVLIIVPSTAFIFRFDYLLFTIFILRREWGFAPLCRVAMTLSHCCKHPVRPLKGGRGSLATPATPLRWSYGSGTFERDSGRTAVLYSAAPRRIVHRADAARNGR